ncbi:unnamed protein product [Rhizoctonia solani]|uniref:Protein kinase domain-containing protein n=1 Tax=Rhizoctonia solani TaxID=456999 RepID=A0A8H2Y1I3_9AGAM|nr:unnamed protein product [Rhizoctonia solani]
MMHTPYTRTMDIPGRSKPLRNCSQVVNDSTDPSSARHFDGRFDPQYSDGPHSSVSTTSSQCLPFTPPTAIPSSLIELGSGAVSETEIRGCYGESPGAALSESPTQTENTFGDNHSHIIPIPAIRTTGLTNPIEFHPAPAISKSVVATKPEGPELDAVSTTAVSPPNRLRRQASNNSRCSTSTVCRFTVTGSMSPPQVESTPVLGQFSHADGVKDDSDPQATIKLRTPYSTSTSSLSKVSTLGGLNPQRLMHRARKSLGRRQTFWGSTFSAVSNSLNRANYNSNRDINLVEEDEHEGGNDQVTSDSFASSNSEGSMQTSSLTQLAGRLKPFRNSIRVFTALPFLPAGSPSTNNTSEGPASKPNASKPKVTAEPPLGPRILPVEYQCDSPSSSPRAQSPVPTVIDVSSCAATNDLRPKNVRRGTSISGQMSASEVVSLLVAHDCCDVTHTINITTFNEHPIFHGGFSDIFRGQLFDGEYVGVKALRVSVESLADNPNHLRQAARELHTWSKCNHPNVMPLLGLAEFRGRIGMVSPWMWNGNLPCYLEKTKGVNRHHLCVQICEGLSYLHRIGIVHGDLKGANVLISEKGVPVLTDFGNAILRDQTLKFTQARSTGGLTARWSAAELLRGDRHTEATDVYALGMMNELIPT